MTELAQYFDCLLCVFHSFHLVDLISFIHSLQWTLLPLAQHTFSNAWSVITFSIVDSVVCAMHGYWMAVLFSASLSVRIIYIALVFSHHLTFIGYGSFCCLLRRNSIRTKENKLYVWCDWFMCEIFGISMERIFGLN